MFVYSEILNKKFATVKECEKAEADYAAAQAKAKAEAEKKAAEAKAKQDALKAEKSARAKEIDAAYAEVIAAQKKYNDLVKAFIDSYGYYHASYKADNVPVFSSLLDFFF